MDFFQKTNIFKFKKFFIVSLLMISLVFAPIYPQQASAAWGEFPQEIFQRVLTWISNNIMEIITSALKTEAIKKINNAIDGIVGGSSSSAPKFITDWKVYLHDKPKENADKYMNDYLSQAVTAGRSSLSGYVKNNNLSFRLSSANYEGVGNGSFNYGLAMNSNFGRFSYIAQADGGTLAPKQNPSDPSALTQIALKHTSEKTTPSLADCRGGDIADASGGFANLRAYLSGVCNQWSFNANAEQVYQEKLAEEKQTASDKAKANAGFISAEKNGQTIGPGILIKDAMANVQNIGNINLATATNPKAVITAVIQSMLTKAIQNGIGQASAAVDKKVEDTKTKATEQLKQKASNQGIGSLFKNK